MALTFDRRAGQSIDVGEARITFTKIRGNRVRVSIEAPKSLAVDRTEVADRKRAEKRRGSAA